MKNNISELYQVKGPDGQWSRSDFGSSVTVVVDEGTKDFVSTFGRV